MRHDDPLIAAIRIFCKAAELPVYDRRLDWPAKQEAMNEALDAVLAALPAQTADEPPLVSAARRLAVVVAQGAGRAWDAETPLSEAASAMQDEFEQIR